MKRLQTLTLTALLAIAVSCGKTETKVVDPVFEKNAPESKAYKGELAEQLKTINTKKVSYYFEDYSVKNGVHYLNINIEGDINAKTVITVNKPDDKLAEIIRTKGKSYYGAELKNLQLDVVKDSLTTKFIYKSVDEVVD